MPHIHIVGLGAGDLTQMRCDVYQHIEQLNGQPLYVRTMSHPVCQALVDKGIHCYSCDAIYEANTAFEQVYPQIVATLHEAAKTHGTITYAVPGHPHVAEQTVKLLLADQSEVTCTVIGGTSFIDDLFSAVAIDPVEGFQLLDALALDTDTINACGHLVIMQVFDQFVASDVKLKLLEIYPPEHRVAVVSAAGTSAEQVSWQELVSLDRIAGIHQLTSVYVSPLERTNNMSQLATTQWLMDEINTHDIWLAAHDHENLLPYLAEEAEEVRDAVAQDDLDNLVEELGDLLLQVFYHAAIGEREGFFTLEDIVSTLNNKLYRRHPHVFGDVTVQSLDELRELWLRIKAQEKEEQCD